MPLIHIPRTNRRFDGNVPIGLNGVVKRIPVGVDYQATDAEVAALVQAGIPIEQMLVPEGCILIPASYGSRLPFGVNGVFSSIVPGVAFVPTAAILAVLASKGIPYRGVGGGVTPTPTPTPSDLFPAIGMNEGYLLGGPSDWSRDLALNSEWIGINGERDNGSMAIGLDGFPRSYYTGQSGIDLALPSCRSAARAGEYVMTYPAGMTVAVLLASGLQVTQAAAGGTMRFTLPASTAAAVHSFLRFSGVIPSSGIAVSVTKVGDASTGIYTDEAVAAFTGLMGSRHMTPLKVDNDSYGSGTQRDAFNMRPASARYRGTTLHGPISMEARIDLATRAGHRVFLENASHVDSDEMNAAKAALFCSTAPISLRPHIELSNEIWNNGGRAQGGEIALMGVRRGYATSTNDPATATPLTVAYNGRGINNATTTALASGERIFMTLNGVGFVVLQALSALAAGTTVNETDVKNTAVGANVPGGQFKLILDNGLCTLARMRFTGKRSQEIWAIWDQKLLAAGRQRSIHAIPVQSANGDFASIAQPILDFGTVWADYDDILTAFYYGRGASRGAHIADLATYDVNYSTPTYPVPWTAAEKNLVATDVPAFLAKFYAAASDALDGALTAATYFNGKMRAYNVSKGRAADDTRQSSYEIEDHYDPGNQGGWPANTQANLATAFGIWKRSAEKAALVKRQAEGMLRLPNSGIHYWFDRIGLIPTSYAGLAGWGMTETDTDTSTANKRWTALLAARPIKDGGQTDTTPIVVPPFSPDSIAGLQEWWTADSGITAASGVVSKCVDQKSGRQATPGGAGPILLPNGFGQDLPALQFGGGKWLATDAPIGETDFTFVLVTAQTPKSNDAGAFIGSGSNGVSIWTNFGGLHVQREYGAGVADSAYGLDFSAASIIVVRYKASTKTADIRLNGQPVASGTGTGSFATFPYTLGHNVSANGSEDITGLMATVLRYSAAISDADAVTIETAYKAKYGIT